MNRFLSVQLVQMRGKHRRGHSFLLREGCDTAQRFFFFSSSHLPFHVSVCFSVCFCLYLWSVSMSFHPQLPLVLRQVEDHTSSAQLASSPPWASQEAGWRGGAVQLPVLNLPDTLHLALALSAVLKCGSLTLRGAALPRPVSVPADGDGGGCSVMLFSCNCVDDMSNTSAISYSFVYLFFSSLHIFVNRTWS